MKAELMFAAAGLALLGCGPAATVERVYDGRTVEGRYIQPEPYAAFLRAAITEAGGDVQAALAAYAAAAEEDAASAETWTRVADLRCRSSLHDGTADQSFSRAVQLDPSYARAWVAKAGCQLARGDVTGARLAARRAAELDPSADIATVLLARMAPRAQDDRARRALLALTVTARDPLLAWDATATWAEARGDLALRVRALEELARIAPARREAIARSSEELAGAGELAEARALAASAADADERPLGGGPQGLAGRLALDQAIASGNAGAVRLRATRVRLGLDEAAGRAFLAGARALASDLAAASSRAEPSARGARLVLAACEGADLRAAAADSRPFDSPASAAAFVAFGVALVRSTTAESARSTLGAIAHGTLVGGDDRVVRPAVELVWRGALDPDALPPEGRVELAALRAASQSSAGVEGEGEGKPSLDARHYYLALALSSPNAARTRELGSRLTDTALSDPLVAAAYALVQLGTGQPIGVDAAGALLARDPGDPLLAITALRLAKRAGDRDGARHAREALNAFAGERVAGAE